MQSLETTEDACFEKDINIIIYTTYTNTTFGKEKLEENGPDDDLAQVLGQTSGGKKSKNC